VVRCQDRPGEPSHRLAVVGERDLVGVPLYQAPVRGALQPGYVLAHRRLADTQARRRGGEVQRRTEREDRSKLGRVERRDRLLVVSIRPSQDRSLCYTVAIIGAIGWINDVWLLSVVLHL